MTSALSKIFIIILLPLFLASCNSTEKVIEDTLYVLPWNWGKGNTIQEENIQQMKANSTSRYVVTAVSMIDPYPIYRKPQYQDPVMYPRGLRSCIISNNPKLRMIERRHVDSVTVGHGSGASMQEAKLLAVKNCNSLNGSKYCMSVVVNGKDICDDETPSFIATWDNAKKENMKEIEKQRQLEQQKLEQIAENQRQKTCENFGFKKETEANKKCQFELYKLEIYAQQNEILRQTINNANNQQNVIQQQILKEQEFQSGMRLLQQGSQILNAPSPIIKCNFNDLMNTMTCR